LGTNSVETQEKVAFMETRREMPLFLNPNPAKSLGDFPEA
jgi:hypothetical protein